MEPGGIDFNYFKLIKLANFVQFKRMFMFGLEDWKAGPSEPLLATPLVFEFILKRGKPDKKSFPIN